MWVACHRLWEQRTAYLCSPSSISSLKGACGVWSNSFHWRVHYRRTKAVFPLLHPGKFFQNFHEEIQKDEFFVRISTPCSCCLFLIDCAARIWQRFRYPGQWWLPRNSCWYHGLCPSPTWLHHRIHDTNLLGPLQSLPPNSARPRQ